MGSEFVNRWVQSAQRRIILSSSFEDPTYVSLIESRMENSKSLMESCVASEALRES